MPIFQNIPEGITVIIIIGGHLMTLDEFSSTHAILSYLTPYLVPHLRYLAYLSSSYIFISPWLLVLTAPISHTTTTTTTTTTSTSTSTTTTTTTQISQPTATTIPHHVKQVSKFWIKGMWNQLWLVKLVRFFGSCNKPGQSINIHTYSTIPEYIPHTPYSVHHKCTLITLITHL